MLMVSLGGVAGGAAWVSPAFDDVDGSCAQQAAARRGCPSNGCCSNDSCSNDCRASLARQTRSLTNGAGSTWCSAAQASFCSSLKQQQCSLQPAALWQPQVRCMHGNATLVSLPRFDLIAATGNGRPTDIAQYASAAATTRPRRARPNEILPSRRKHITKKTPKFRLRRLAPRLRI